MTTTNTPTLPLAARLQCSPRRAVYPSLAPQHHLLVWGTRRPAFPLRYSRTNGHLTTTDPARSPSQVPPPFQAPPTMNASHPNRRRRRSHSSGHGTGRSASWLATASLRSTTRARTPSSAITMSQPASTTLPPSYPSSSSVRSPTCGHSPHVHSSTGLDRAILKIRQCVLPLHRPYTADTRRLPHQSLYYHPSSICCTTSVRVQGDSRGFGEFSYVLFILDGQRATPELS